MPPAPGQDEPIKRMAKIVNSFLARPDIAPFSEPVDWRGLELYDYPKVIKKMMDLGTIKRRLERGQYQTAHQVAEDMRLVWSNCMTYNADGSDFWLLAKSYARRFEDRYRKVRNEFDVGEDLEDISVAASTKSNSKQASSTGSTAGTKSSKSNSAATGNGGATKDTISSSLVNASSSSLSLPLLDARAKFGANLFLLSGMELGWVMTELELHCPHVLESWTSDTTENRSSSSSSNNNYWTQHNNNQYNNQSKVEINVDEIPAEIFNRINKYVTGLIMQPDNASNDGYAMEQEIPKKKRRKS